MAQNKAPKTSEFDSIVIGGGLRGLLVAELLEATGRQVAIVEARETLGGETRPFQSQWGAVDQGLKFFPATSSAEADLDWLQTQLRVPIQRTLIDAPPVTFDSGRLQPFVGFGDQPTEAMWELDYFLSPAHWRIEPAAREWAALLAERFTGKVFLQSQVTRLLADDQFVVDLMLNGSRRLSANEYFFCASPSQLLRLLPESFVSAKARQRLQKGPIYAALQLDLFHSHGITESSALHVLRGANEEPVVGLFHPAFTSSDGQVVQHSQWLTFVRQELIEDSEFVATALRRIKRQIKRAYELAHESLRFERIAVSPPHFGEISGLLSESGHWPKLDNLWLIGHQFSKEPGLWGMLRQLRQVLQPILLVPPARDQEDSPVSPDPVIEV